MKTVKLGLVIMAAALLTIGLSGMAMPSIQAVLQIVVVVTPCIARKQEGLPF